MGSSQHGENVKIKKHVLAERGNYDSAAQLMYFLFEISAYCCIGKRTRTVYK